MLQMKFRLEKTETISDVLKNGVVETRGRAADTKMAAAADPIRVRAVFKFKGTNNDEVRWI